jgi:hypothetical protein
MALASVTSALFGNFFAALYTIYALDELGLSPFLLGVVISAGGVGSLAASLLVGPITRRAGFGPAIVWTRVGAGVLASLCRWPVDRRSWPQRSCSSHSSSATASTPCRSSTG